VTVNFDENNYAEWVETLPGDSRTLIEGATKGGFVKPDDWYDLRAGLVVPARSIVEYFYGGIAVAARAMGMFAAEKALTGFIGFMVKRGKPTFIAKRAPSVVNVFYRPCHTEVTDLGDKHAVIRIAEFPDIDPVVEYRVQGWMEKALLISGAKDPRVEITAALSKGEPFTEFVGSWEL
jgi:hypothetical protein